MSLITLNDLPCTTDLDQHAMCAVRGGHGWARDVSVDLKINQSLVQVQDVDLNVLNNNGSIGAGFTGPTVNLAAAQTGFNSAVIPKMF
ncbi:hypothetical protein [Duganella aceris]|uniref:Uncharacterized protein n=1 Tax=Duganella aceris TaxID=2703883 RepID=A0ABX0FKZ2_9BURK|nr:hypothetical protein [Duganella aceris]NGZ85129.1 hypothetical protein [Duganella aceris]